MKQKTRTSSAKTQGFTAQKLVIIIGVLAAIVLVVLLIINWRNNAATPAPDAPGTPVSGQSEPPQAVTQKTPRTGGGSSQNSAVRP